MLITTVATTALLSTVAAYPAPPGDPRSGVQALLLYLLGHLAALWANAPTKPLRLLVERALRSLRPLLLDPPQQAPSTPLLPLAESALLIERLHLALCWEARGLVGWGALNASLEQLVGTLKAELTGRAA